MNFARLLLFGAIAYLVWRMLNPPLRRSDDRQRRAAPPDYEPMARCVQCGTHMPVASLSAGGRCRRCS
ncbi:hypothetical protein [Solimonas terrae]|uniref:Uncharacterized protein n=1 Tax=Solimonas terrae TaxID=1396819 RepID=A0A6M2BTG0_9GAMM|nr:hypothetical protein [Solimonas terrae]NGY05257.1 hypothetical protein [Solimonas terrae]